MDIGWLSKVAHVKRRVGPWVGTLLRLVVGVVWIVAGAIKLPTPESSVTAVRGYQLLPIGTTDLIGHLLPILEIAVGVLLVLGLFTRVAAALSALMQIAFLIGIASVWIRHIPINCGCFGDGGATSWEQARSAYPWELARDTGLFLASAFLAVWPRTRVAVDGWLFPAPMNSQFPSEESDHVEVQP